MNSAAIDHSKITLLDYCNLAFLNGVHHWYGSSVTDDNGNRKYTEAIVSFDMSHEVCGLIKLPNGVFSKQSLPQQDSTVFSFMKELALFNNCLALIVFNACRKIPEKYFNV